MRVGTRTGTPEEVRTIATSVGEKSKLEDALADANFASTSSGRDSDRPSCIIVGYLDEKVHWWSGRSAFFGKMVCTDELRADLTFQTSQRLHSHSIVIVSSCTEYIELCQHLTAKFA